MEHKIKQLANFLTDGKISVLERKIGVSSSRLDKVVKRNSKIGLDIVNSIVEKYPMINEKWFESDLEPMTLSNEEIPYYKKRLAEKNRGDYEDNSAPLVPVKAQAGYTRSYDQTDYIDTLERFALPPGITRHGAIWRYWEIEGESMEPTFYSKDIILTSQVHPMDWNDLRNFYTYVIVMSNSVYIKRVYRKTDDEWVLISDNEDNGYEQFAINPKDIKEVWVFRRHIDSKAPAPKQFKIKI